MNRFRMILADSLLFAALLTCTSVLQKLYIGVEIRDLRGYFVPLLFGGFVGAMVGALRYSRVMNERHRLEMAVKPSGRGYGLPQTDSGELIQCAERVIGCIHAIRSVQETPDLTGILAPEMTQNLDNLEAELQRLVAIGDGKEK